MLGRGHSDGSKDGGGRNLGHRLIMVREGEGKEQEGSVSNANLRSGGTNIGARRRVYQLVISWRIESPWG